MAGPARHFIPSSASNRAGFMLRHLALLLLVVVHSVQALPEDADQDIEIKAERAELDQRAGVTTYIGNVRVNQGTMRVTADRMRMEHENRKIVRITATGDPAHYQQQVESDQLRARAKTIVYHTQEERVHLEGKAYVEHGDNEIAGAVIIYDIAAGRINAESGEDGPVTVTVKPPGRNE